MVYVTVVTTNVFFESIHAISAANEALTTRRGTNVVGGGVGEGINNGASVINYWKCFFQFYFTRFETKSNNLEIETKQLNIKHIFRNDHYISSSHTRFSVCLHVCDVYIYI